jgi:hypothetical protein
MKTAFRILMTLCVSGCLLTSGTADAQDKPYTEGTVWSVDFIKVKPNMGGDYLKSLATTWVKVHEEAVAQGLIVSYKVLSGSAANPEDFDIILMTESRNMAAFDTDDDAKWKAIYDKVVGGEEVRKTLNQSRLDMREIHGSKLMRELRFK